MQRIHQWLARAVVATALAVTLGACANDALSGFSNFTLIPKEGLLGRSDRTFSGGNVKLTAGPASAEDLVSSNGQCALPANVASAQATEPPPTEGAAPPAQPTAPLVRGGVALQMTECEVVSRAGPVEKVDIGSNERGERAVTITYLRGPWPGVYRFTEGRLASIDRVVEPPAPKPKKPAKSTKPANKPAA